MQRRSYIAGLLALFLLFFCSCQNQPILIEGTESNSDLDPQASESTTWEERESVSEKPGEAKLYFDCPEHYGTILTDISSAGFLEFYILSDRPLNTEEIEVSTGIRAQSKVEITPMELRGIVLEDGNEVISPDTCPYYVYLCYQVADWTPFEQLEAQYREANGSGRIELENQIKMLWQETIANGQSPEEWNKQADQIRYAYNIRVFFLAPTEEVQTTEQMIVTVSGTPYVVALGHLSVDTRSTSNTYGYRQNYEACFQTGVGYTSAPGYSRGWFRGNDSAGDFMALEDIIVTRISPFAVDSDLTVTAIEIAVEDPSGLPVSFQWDGKTPFSVPAGTSFSITPTCYSEHMDVLGYCSETYLKIDYWSQSGEKWQEICCVAVHSVPNPYAYYAQYADGVDLKSYYHFVFNPTEGGYTNTLYYGDES